MKNLFFTAILIITTGTTLAARPHPQAKKFGNSYYYVFTDKANFVTALNRCASMGGSLAVIDNDQEYRHILGLMKGNATWIGVARINKQGPWAWISGKQLNRGFPWDSGQPSNSDAELSAALHPHGKIHDHHWWDQLHYVCEWPIEKAGQDDRKKKMERPTKKQAKSKDAMASEDNQQAQEPKPAKPYDYKGDVLGAMTLKQFKKKYARNVPGHNENAPFCSDDNPKMVGSEPWHRKAKVVIGSVIFPFEEAEHNEAKYGKNVPTIAGIKVKSQTYYFVDKKLARLSMYFPHDGFSDVKSALIKKFGEPDSVSIDKLQNAFGATFQRGMLMWDNGRSQITLEEYGYDIKNSLVIFYDNKLYALYLKRSPKPKTDDI